MLENDDMAMPSPGSPVLKQREPGIDLLTGLLRGAALEASLLRALLQNRRGGQSPVLVYFGIDRFRHLNELLGFEAGDTALKEVAWRLRTWAAGEQQFRRIHLARMGGDEFAILCEGSNEPVPPAAERLLQQLRVPFNICDREIFLTMSAGVAVAPAELTEALGLLRRASGAMTKAKNRGGNVVEVAAIDESINPEYRYELESALRTAIERGEFSLRFQPQVDRHCHLDGLEVLLAWNNPQLGAVEPELFIKLAEEIGAISPIGDWVLEQTCLQIATWRKEGLKPPRVAVNVSAIQFAAPEFVDQVRAVLEKTGVPGEALEFEITERTVLRDVAESAERMRELRTMGISIAIDDFGVGYSPLTYLQHLPLDAVKVDRAFTGEITKPAGSLPLVHTITVLAHQRGLKVVAEGVETQGELEMVRAARCDRMQGYLFGTPVSAVEFEVFLRNPVPLGQEFGWQPQASGHF